MCGLSILYTFLSAKAFNGKLAFHGQEIRMKSTLESSRIQGSAMLCHSCFLARATREEPAGMDLDALPIRYGHAA